jgi:hypothetical protein
VLREPAPRPQQTERTSGREVVAPHARAVPEAAPAITHTVRVDALGRRLAGAVARRAAREPADPSLPSCDATGPARPLQRLVGFEAEYSVPTMPDPSKAQFDWTFRLMNKTPPNSLVLPGNRIETFLTGGLPYGESPALGDMTHDFQLKADHNDLQERHIAIREKLVALGYTVPPWIQADGKPITMSNLEYVTPPADELAPRADTTIKLQLHEIETHARGVFAGAATDLRAIAAPAAGAHVGIPEQDLRGWLGDDYENIEPEVDAFKEEIKDSFYLQATVGIIPSALPDLFKRRMSPTEATMTTVFEAAADAVHFDVQGLLAQDSFKNDPWVQALARDHPVDYEAFVGMLYLIDSYFIGHALNQTSLLDGSSEKNAVPFLSKLDDLGIAMTHAVPTHIRGLEVPPRLISTIDGFLQSKEPVTVHYWKRQFSLQDPDPAQTQRDPVIADPSTFVDDVLNSKGPETVGSPRSFAEPDAIATQASSASGDQAGIQLEYRYILNRPGASGLTAELMKVVEEVRELNTRHMNPDERDELLRRART